jgi:hypothetical protein
LETFGIKTFEKLGIYDDNDHKIKLRKEYEYDYFLNKKDKEIEQIFDEIKEVLDL